MSAPKRNAVHHADHHDSEPQLIRLKRFHDARGFFCETYSRSRCEESGITVEFVQDNISLTRRPGTIRGMHLQRAPFAQCKLLTVLNGSILDAIVDLRPGAGTYGKVEMFELSDRQDTQLFVPAGFAHGFCTLAPDTVIHYKVSAPYSPADEEGIHPLDPMLGIAWPYTADEILISEKDAAQPSFLEYRRICQPARGVPRRRLA